MAYKNQKLTPEQLKKVTVANRKSGKMRRGIIPKNLSSLNGKNHWNYKGGIDTPEHRSMVKNKRNKLIKNLLGKHSTAEWNELKKKYGNFCASCLLKKPLTRDHIIPVGHPECTNSIDNIQPLCVSCNTKKGAGIIRFPLPVK